MSHHRRPRATANDLSVAGFIFPILSPKYFIGSQLPSSSLSITQQTILSGVVVNDPTAKLITWQLGNCYLLFAFVGVFILNTTTELKVVRAYLFALWLGDIGHLGITLYAMGLDGILDFGNWSSVVWGNIGITFFLFIVRSLYLQGFLDDKVDVKPPALSTRGKTGPKTKSKGL
jgi:hypothetical protein